MFDKSLFHKNILLIQPEIAVALGVNEAIVLQQIHYWLEKSNHYYEGCCWTYNTYNNWHEQFPFFSESTIKRTIRSLEKRNILICSSVFNKIKLDRTKWYTINYDELEKVINKKFDKNQVTDGAVEFNVYCADLIWTIKWLYINTSIIIMTT